MNIQQFVKETFKERDGYCFRPRLVCNDGFSMSVQGSAGHYCSPRKTQDWYDSMEIGFPSSEEELIINYAECENSPCDTVYGFVPIEVIQQVIEKHNGIDVEKSSYR